MHWIDNKSKEGWVWKRILKQLKRHEQTSNQWSTKIYFLSTQTLHHPQPFQADVTDVFVAVDIANFQLILI